MSERGIPLVSSDPALCRYPDPALLPSHRFHRYAIFPSSNYYYLYERRCIFSPTIYVSILIIIDFQELLNESMKYY